MVSSSAKFELKLGFVVIFPPALLPSFPDIGFAEQSLAIVGRWTPSVECKFSPPAIWLRYIQGDFFYCSGLKLTKYKEELKYQT